MKYLDKVIIICGFFSLIAISIVGIKEHTRKINNAMYSLKQHHKVKDHDYPQGQDPIYSCDKVSALSVFIECSVVEWRVKSYYLCPSKNTGACLSLGQERIKRPTNYGTIE